MPRQHLLLIDAHRLRAYRWRSGQLHAEADFSPDRPGLEDFAQFLGQHRRSTFHLLAELAEQGFQQDDIPYVTGRDRRALLARKLSQHFYGAALALTLSLGRDTPGRRYEKLLFAALTRPQQLEPWLGLLCQAEARIAGIYTVPLLAGTLAARAGRSAPLLLFLTLTSGGIHQTLFENGGLRLSRLTAMATDNLEECAAACATESAKIHQYLAAQRLIAHGTALSVVVLVHPGQLSYFRSRCKDTELLKFSFADLLAEAQRQGLKSLPRDTRSEPLLLHLMAKRPPRAQFANPALRRFYRLGQIRFALQGIGVAALLAGVLIAAGQIYDFFQLRGQTEQIRLQAEADRQRYAAVQQGFPAMPVDFAKLRALVDRYDKLEQDAVAPEATYQRISRALELTPGVEISRIDWQAASLADQGSAGRVIADLYARLPLAQVGDPRVQLDTIDNFSTELARDSRVAVKKLKLPFDIESDQSLKSSGEAIPNFDAPRFSVRLVEKW